MPTYDYQCELNSRVVEVKHKMAETVTTWGELCNLAGISMGDTPSDAPVKKLATGGQVVNSRNLGKNGEPACASGPCCGAGNCDFTN